MSTGDFDEVSLSVAQERAETEADGPAHDVREADRRRRHRSGFVISSGTDSPAGRGGGLPPSLESRISVRSFAQLNAFSPMGNNLPSGHVDAPPSFLLRTGGQSPSYGSVATLSVTAPPDNDTENNEDDEFCGSPLFFPVSRIGGAEEARRHPFFLSPARDDSSGDIFARRASCPPPATTSGTLVGGRFVCGSCGQTNSVGNVSAAAGADLGVVRAQRLPSSQTSLAGSSKRSSRTRLNECEQPDSRRRASVDTFNNNNNRPPSNAVSMQSVARSAIVFSGGGGGNDNNNDKEEAVMVAAEAETTGHIMAPTIFTNYPPGIYPAHKMVPKFGGGGGGSPTPIAGVGAQLSGGPFRGMAPPAYIIDASGLRGAPTYVIHDGQNPIYVISSEQQLALRRNVCYLTLLLVLLLCLLPLLFIGLFEVNRRVRLAATTGGGASRSVDS